MRDKFKVNSTFYSRYTFYDLGYNLRPTEINGFIGNTQVKYLDEIIKKRRDNFIYIAEKIYANENYYPLRFDHIDLVSNFAVPVICKTKAIRDRLVEKCNGKVEIRPIVGGDMTQQPFFSKYMKKNSKENPNAKLIHEQGLYFGNNPEMTKKEIDTIISIFLK
jgi:CDP-6-deoxy-D-xylo-4-hexulose-3-dehydrase